MISSILPKSPFETNWPLMYTVKTEKFSPWIGFHPQSVVWYQDYPFETRLPGLFFLQKSWTFLVQLRSPNVEIQHVCKRLKQCQWVSLDPKSRSLNDLQFVFQGFWHIAVDLKRSGNFRRKFWCKSTKKITNFTALASKKWSNKNNSAILLR